jgi:hypothetical protein
VERNLRGHFGRKVWLDKNGERQLSQTSCDTCASSTPGIYEACGNIVSERIESSPAIRAAFEAWANACGTESGPRCFTGIRGRLWHAFLQSIIDHGGWKNVNDDQVKLEALRLAEEARRKRNAAARESRRRQREAGRGTPSSITLAELQPLQDERDRRAAKLKSLCDLARQAPRAMPWLSNLPDASCDRTSDVWWARELLSRQRRRVTGRAIAELMIDHGRNYGLRIESLTSRVHEDLKRIKKLEDDRAGAPLWTPWTYRPAGAP